LSAGFRRHAIPYLTPDETDQLRATLRNRLPPALGKVSPRDLPLAVHPAAALGMHEQMEELFSGWRERPGRFSAHGRLDVPCLAFGLTSAARVSGQLRRLGVRLSTPEHVRGWLAHTELADLGMIEESVAACTAKADAHALLAVLARVKSPDVA